MLGKYRGKIDCTADELAEIFEEYAITCPINKNGWVYGSLIDGDKPYIVGQVIESIPYGGIVLDYWYPVKKNTVGQYTGFKDKNGTEIYEGDIVQARLNIQEYANFVVEFADGCFEIRQGNYREYLKVAVANRVVKIIGNIHDNPELSEVKE